MSVLGEPYEKSMVFGARPSVQLLQSALKTSSVAPACRKRFFNMPDHASTWDQPFYTAIPTHHPISRLYDTLGIRRTHSRLNPRALTGVHVT